MLGSDIIKELEADVAKLIRPSLVNIQSALGVIAASKGDLATVASQEAIILAEINKIALEAPALLPVLTAQAITAGAELGGQVVQKAIDYIDSLVPADPKTA